MQYLQIVHISIEQANADQFNTILYKYIYIYIFALN